MAFLKPQSPLTKGNDYFYPLTTADQVIMQDGYRLDQIVGKVEKSTITLYANRWSTEAPHSYSVTVKGLDDNINMKMFPHFPEDFEGKQAMKEETAKISFASRNGSILTFECWEEVPTIDIPVDIEINVLYPLEAAIDMDEIESQLTLFPKLNFVIEEYNDEDTMLNSVPSENTIGIIPINSMSKWIFSNTQPENVINNTVWFQTKNELSSDNTFNSLIIQGNKLNSITIAAALQYTNNEWTEIPVKVFKNNNWQTMKKYLYYYGNNISNFETYVGTTSPPNIKFSTNGINVISDGSKVHQLRLKCDILDFSNYSYLKMKMCVNSVPSGTVNKLYSGLEVTLDPNTIESGIAYSRISDSNGQSFPLREVIYTVNLEAVSNAYILYWFDFYQQVVDLTIQEIWLEP